MEPTQWGWFASTSVTVPFFHQQCNFMLLFITEQPGKIPTESVVVSLRQWPAYRRWSRGVFRHRQRNRYRGIIVHILSYPRETYRPPITLVPAVIIAVTTARSLHLIRFTISGKGNRVRVEYSTGVHDRVVINYCENNWLTHEWARYDIARRTGSLRPGYSTRSSSSSSSSLYFPTV